MALGRTVALLILALLAGGQAMAQTVTNSLGMQLALIPAGVFMMGQAEGGDWDERPVHLVTLTQPFWMGVTEVTNSQYELFDPSHKALRGKLGFSTADDEAVVFVSWEEATRFCEWLSQKEGKPYRLPTEAEWEYACRAGTTTHYSTGDDLPPEMHKNVRLSWYPDTARDPADQPVPLTVGKTAPNAWGLQDMHGNVEEWCADWYGPYEAEDQTDPVGRTTGDFRVTRGGSHSTELRYLRSANRAGTLPQDKSWLIGFRVVQAPQPTTAPLPVPEKPLNAQNVDQTVRHLPPLDTDKPYFAGPIPYVKVPADSQGPLFSKHNHDPAIVACPNGDLLAIWYTCLTEPGRELGIAASRLRYGTEEWEPASPFWDAPDRNDHAPALMADDEGNLYHFNGLAAGGTWGNLATILRVSSDSGATWSAARLIMPEHGTRHMPVESAFVTREGDFLLPCDAVTGGRGGTAVHLSRDRGLTWHDQGEGKPQPTFAEGTEGGWVAGIHGGVVQLSDGCLMGFGRDNNNRGRMTMSLSADLGETWTYQASDFPPIDGGQRLALLRLREGPILIITFTDHKRSPLNTMKGITVRNAAGHEVEVYGMFGAVSFDEGRTWPIKKLLTPGGPAQEMNGGGNTGKFIMDATHAEPAGYLSITQSEDGVIHLISSRLHYRFNLAWLEEPMPGDTH